MWQTVIAWLIVVLTIAIGIRAMIRNKGKCGSCTGCPFAEDCGKKGKD